MNTTSPMFSAAYDSEKPDAATDELSARLKAVLAPMIGQPYTVVMAPTGEVVKVDGLSKLAEKMFSNMPADPASAGMLDGLKASLSDDAMRSLLSQSFAQAPNRALKIGESWTAEIVQNNPMLGGTITSVKMTLKAVAGEDPKRMATIGIDSTVKQDPAKPGAPNPMGMTLQLSTGDRRRRTDLRPLCREARSVCRPYDPADVDVRWCGDELEHARQGHDDDRTDSVEARLRQGYGEVSPKRFARRRTRVGESEGRSPSDEISVRRPPR